MNFDKAAGTIGMVDGGRKVHSSEVVRSLRKGYPVTYCASKPITYVVAIQGETGSVVDILRHAGIEPDQLCGSCFSTKSRLMLRMRYTD